MSSTTCTTIFSTQDDVPELIEKLYHAKLEVLDQQTFTRDPHLRLRRTLTPRSHITGVKKYEEVQFVIHPTTARSRRSLPFQVPCSGENNNNGTKEFYMDAYSWGASEEEATIRMVALHGMSPGVSRERWHALGTRIQNDPLLNRHIRFVALDWHSIDRGDEYQEDFLTLLPKHIFDCVSDDQKLEELIDMVPPDCRENFLAMHHHFQENCPRRFSEAADILRAVITQGLGWGTATKSTSSKPFILCSKSWSGGVCMEMLHRVALAATTSNTDDDPTNVFQKSIMGAVIMHPACFTKSAEEVKQALNGIPNILMVWAKDDHLAPYPLSQRYLVLDNVELNTYETGKHGSFNGSDPNEPANFDDRVLEWLREKYIDVNAVAGKNDMKTHER